MIRWKPLLIHLAIPLAVGGVSALINQAGMEKYGALKQPPLSPPMWLFPVVWTVLFILMGLSMYWVYLTKSEQRKGAMVLYGAQLAANFLWPVFYFTLGMFYFALGWLAVLFALVLLMAIRFYQIERRAGLLQLPYLLWLLFAGYLNYMTAALNP